MAALFKPIAFLGLLGVAAATWVDPATLDACPGYKAVNIQDDGSTLTADLTLAGKACNVFGTDIQQLKLEVAYETGLSSLLAIVRRQSQLTMDIVGRHPHTPQDHRPGSRTV